MRQMKSYDDLKVTLAYQSKTGEVDDLDMMEDLFNEESKRPNDKTIAIRNSSNSSNNSNTNTSRDNGNGKKRCDDRMDPSRHLNNDKSNNKSKDEMSEMSEMSSEWSDDDLNFFEINFEGKEFELENELNTIAQYIGNAPKLIYNNIQSVKDNPNSVIYKMDHWRKDNGTSLSDCIFQEKKLFAHPTIDDTNHTKLRQNELNFFQEICIKDGKTVLRDKPRYCQSTWFEKKKFKCPQCHAKMWVLPLFKVDENNTKWKILLICSNFPRCQYPLCCEKSFWKQLYLKEANIILSKPKETAKATSKAKTEAKSKTNEKRNTKEKENVKKKVNEFSDSDKNDKNEQGRMSMHPRARLREKRKLQQRAKQEKREKECMRKERDKLESIGKFEMKDERLKRGKKKGAPKGTRQTDRVWHPVNGPIPVDSLPVNVKSVSQRTKQGAKQGGKQIGMQQAHRWKIVQTGSSPYGVFANGTKTSMHEEHLKNQEKANGNRCKKRSFAEIINANMNVENSPMSSQQSSFSQWPLSDSHSNSNSNSNSNTMSDSNANSNSNSNSWTNPCNLVSPEPHIGLPRNKRAKLTHNESEREKERHVQRQFVQHRPQYRCQYPWQYQDDQANLKPQISDNGEKSKLERTKSHATNNSSQWTFSSCNSMSSQQSSSCSRSSLYSQQMSHERNLLGAPLSVVAPVGIVSPVPSVPSVPIAPASEPTHQKSVQIRKYSHQVQCPSAQKHEALKQPPPPLPPPPPAYSTYPRYCVNIGALSHPSSDPRFSKLN